MKRIALAVALLIALATPSQADYLEGEVAYSRGDYATALLEFKPLAEKGHAKAQHDLGFMYEQGRGVPQDYAEAAKWYRKAAEQGHAWAQTMLSRLYKDGWGVPQDYGEAVKWLSKAAEQGLVFAEHALCLAYESGEGVLQDYMEAVKWCRKAAEQNWSIAQVDLGALYASGKGVTKNLAEAGRWFRKAAVLGNYDAQFRIGLAYLMGSGVPQDFVQGHAWLNLAAAGGNKTAEEWREKTSRRMNSSQLAEAQRLARNWRYGQQLAPRNIPDLKPRPTPRRQRREMGSGFIVTANGQVLTNNHVVAACREIKIQSKRARIVASDKSSDLALLKVEGRRGGSYATFRGGRGVRVGEDTIVAGFPLQGLLSTDLNVTKGTVSALSGPGKGSHAREGQTLCVFTRITRTGNRLRRLSIRPCGLGPLRP